jgi:25S rRNA (uracil2634-N3)-methyltransferase
MTIADAVLRFVALAAVCLSCVSSLRVAPVPLSAERLLALQLRRRSFLLPVARHCLVRRERALWQMSLESTESCGQSAGKQHEPNTGDGGLARMRGEVADALEPDTAERNPESSGDSTGGGLADTDGTNDGMDWLAEWSDFLSATAHEGTSTPVVLIVGDGNLSYSLAMAKAIRGMKLIATTYDSEDCVVERYGAADVIRELKDRGVTVAHGIDATALEETLSRSRCVELGTTPDCILFNFPHHPGKGRIQKNRDLLRDFFKSAARLVASKPSSIIRVALAAGQGGTPIDKPRLWGDTWQVTAQAAEAGLLLCEVKPFRPPAGYYCRGYRSQDKGFRLSGALVHVFRPEGQGRRGIFPPEWTHDISFWVPPTFDATHFYELAKQNESVIRVEELEVFSRAHLPEAAATFHASLPPEYQESRTFRVTYASCRVALSKEAARDQQIRLRAAAADTLNVVLR